MANIRERVDSTGVSSFQAQVRIKGYPPQSSSFPTKTLAKRWAQQTETEIRSGSITLAPAGKHTMLQLLEYYEKTKSPKKAKGGQDDEAPIAWWKASIGSWYLNAITPRIIETALDKFATTLTKRGKPPAAATSLRYLMLLSHAFTVAISLKWEVRTNPVNDVADRPQPKNGRKRFLSDEERAALIRACRDSTSKHLLLVVVLAISTGMRKGEILGLKWRDLTFSVDRQFAKALLSRTKNKEDRSAMISGAAFDLLQEKMQMMPGSEMQRAEALLFPSTENADIPVDIRTPWETALKRSQISDFRFHDLRHTAASYLAQDGTSIQEIAAVLGHKTVRMAERYAHLTAQRSDEVVKRMNTRIKL